MTDYLPILRTQYFTAMSPISNGGDISRCDTFTSLDDLLIAMDYCVASVKLARKFLENWISAPGLDIPRISTCTETMRT